LELKETYDQASTGNVSITLCSVKVDAGEEAKCDNQRQEYYNKDNIRPKRADKIDKTE
jgi:hypothetical protein